MTLTKANLSEQLLNKFKIDKKDSKKLIESFFERIRSALEDGEQVRLSGFGCFDLKNKNERPGRNPKTGKDALIRARRVVVFRSGQKLRNRIEHNYENIRNNL